MDDGRDENKIKNQDKVKDKEGLDNQESKSPNLDIDKTEPISENEKPANAFAIIVAIIMLIFGLLIVSVIFYKGDGSGTQTLTYNGFTIMNISGQWYTQIQVAGTDNLHTIEMRYGPMQVEDLTVQETVVKRITSADKILLTTDPNLNSRSVIAMIELGRITGERYQILSIPTISGLTNSSGTDSRQITCTNSTIKKPVVYFRTNNQSTQPNSYMEGLCIIVEGKTEEDLIRIADRIGYELMGLI